MKMLILGSGPAGLLAAHAASYASEYGVQIAIVSEGKKSELFGCQYLHGPIPGLDLRTTTVEYKLAGDAAGYAQKVYGSRLMAGTVSPSSLTGSHPAWDIRQAYDQLWNRWEPYITPMTLTPMDIMPLLEFHLPDMVVSSIPLPVLCQNEDHAFRAEECWALGDAPERGQHVPVPCPPDTVVCNGTSDTGWYRVSHIFGYKTAEWPGLRPKPPLSGVTRFRKPLATTCDCWQPEGRATTQRDYIHRVGRYGTWTKGVLSHEAFHQTFARVQERVHAS